MIGQAILEGALAGLILSVFVGPIFFTMLQLGIEHGFRAAFALALGQWMSDFFYIFLAFWGAVWVEDIIKDPARQSVFVWYTSVIGGCLLMAFGLGLLLTKSISTATSSKIKIAEPIAERQISKTAFFAYFSQGFLINTINPTPLIFWMGLMAFAINKNYIGGTTFVLYCTVMSVVIGTDLLKIYLAKSIRNKLKVHHILQVRRLAGIILGGFGLILLGRVLFFA